MSSTALKAGEEKRSADELDQVFGALADRTRRAILARLAKGPAQITALAEPFDMSLPAVSKHVRVLERAGLVDRRIDGRVHCCSLNTDPLQQIETWVEHYRNFWESTLDAFAEHMEAEIDER